MKLRALHLTNVRRFTGKRASITGIGGGITVVCEANEFGKSTFFDALHALFFEKFSSSARPVKSLQPYAGGSVEVMAEVETDQGTFRVEKRFLSRKTARIVRLSDGATIAQDDEAERWISTLLGVAGEGPAGLLWVRQGLLGLEPDNRAEKDKLTETRRDLMSSVAGEIDAMTGGRRMDRIMRRVAEDLGEIATKTGRRTGPWKAAADEVEALEAELGKLTTQVDVLEGALAERKAKEAMLGRLDDPEATTRREHALLAAQSAVDTARAHAGLVHAAQQNQSIAVLNDKNAKSELDAFLAAFDALASAQGLALQTKDRAAEAKEAESALKERLDAARAAEDRARTALTDARAAFEAAGHQAEARKALETVLQLADCIAKALEAQDRQDAAAARMKASVVTPEWLERAEKAVGEVAQAEAVLQAQITTVRLDYSGEIRIDLNGSPLSGGQAVPLDGETHLNLPGIGKMIINAQSLPQTSLDKLAKARASCEARLGEAGIGTIQEARLQARERAEAARQMELAKAVLETLAPNGLAALQAAKAEAELAAAKANDTALPPLPELQAAVMAAASLEEQAMRDRRLREADHATAREVVARALTAAEAAALALDRATMTAGPADTRDARRTELIRAAAQTSQALSDAESRLAELIASAPDQTSAEAELIRAKDASTTAIRQRAQVAERLAELSAEIRTQAGNGIEERRDEIQGQLEAARATEARFARKAAALTRLQAAVETERSAAQEAYFGPVQEELKPLLSILHRDAALTFDSDSLLPSGLTRGQAEETLEDLSGGTREQIAILTRLAFARLFARQGRHMPIVLDDALVYSDDDRIIKMFTALTRVAQDQQIIVFSCRQLAFQDLGGERPTVEISDV